MTIAPGIFETPMLAELPRRRASRCRVDPVPVAPRPPDEYADLACHIVTNEMLNGEVIRLDGAIRMPPR